MTTINLKKESYLNEESIIAFHIGRGGRFYNPGYCTIKGEYDIRYYFNTLNLFVPTDDEGNEIEGEIYAGDGNGVGLTTSELETGIGKIDIDGEYNTTYTIRLKDIDIYGREGEAIRNALNHNDGDSWTAENIVRWLCEGEDQLHIDCILEQLDLEEESDEEDDDTEE